MNTILFEQNYDTVYFEILEGELKGFWNGAI